jgi:hypothetical protein
MKTFLEITIGLLLVIGSFAIHWILGVILILGIIYVLFYS